MGTPTSEVSYTSATTRREHEVYMDMWWHCGKKFILEQAMKVQRGRGGIALLFL
jgi:hypothetical protein